MNIKPQSEELLTPVMGRPKKAIELRYIRNRSAEAMLLPDLLLAGVAYKIEDVLSQHGIPLRDVTKRMSEQAVDILALKQRV